MQNLNYLIFTISLTFLYWFTFTAYDRVIRTNTMDVLPLLPKQSCIVTHLEIKKDDNKVNDLSIYYSGIKKPDTEQSNAKVIQNEEKVQEEILKIVKDKQDVVEVVKKPLAPKNTEIKDNIKIKVMQKPQDDAFSVLTKKKQKKSSNIFDVLE